MSSQLRYYKIKYSFVFTDKIFCLILNALNIDEVLEKFNAWKVENKMENEEAELHDVEIFNDE